VEVNIRKHVEFTSAKGSCILIRDIPNLLPKIFPLHYLHCALGQEVCTHLLKSYLMEDYFWHARRKDRYVQLAVKGEGQRREHGTEERQSESYATALGW
jgi:hypothetical protein